jgi:Ca-activated chloride channel homolog
MSTLGLCRRRCFKGPLSLSLSLAFSIFVSLAWSQSEDQVHVVPRDRIDQPAAKTDAVHLNGEPTFDAPTKPFRVDVDLVLVPVTVTDTMNHAITGLQKQNFTLYQHDQPQEIRYFSVEDGPISVGLILDVSKSMSNKVGTEGLAVADFFRNANPQDDYFVVTVSDRPKLLATSTQSIGTIQSKLALTVPDGSTALLDAVYLGVSQLRAARYPRRALLIISDGGDNNSRYRLREIKDILRESDVQAYAIGLFDTALFKTFEEYMGKKWLGEITDATGGHSLAVDNLAGVPEAAATISWELRHQYVLGFKPNESAADGKWRKIKVRITPPPQSRPLQAHYKMEYSTAGR